MDTSLLVFTFIYDIKNVFATLYECFVQNLSFFTKKTARSATFIERQSHQQSTKYLESKYSKDWEMFFKGNRFWNYNGEYTSYDSLVIHRSWLYQARKKCLFEFFFNLIHLNHSLLFTLIFSSYLNFCLVRVTVWVKKSLKQHTFHHLATSREHVAIVKQTLINFTLRTYCY